MGGGDDCFLSDIWIPLAALGILTQDPQLPEPNPPQAPHGAHPQLMWEHR